MERDWAAITSSKVFFVDDDIRCVSPEHRADALALFRLLATNPWPSIMQAATNICADTEVLDAARSAGCRMLFLGLETGDTEGLQAVHKGVNLRSGFDFSHVHKAGLAVLGSFLVGLDTDTPEKIKERAKFMVECGADALQLTVATPLPGTALFEQLSREQRLRYTHFPEDWDRYDLTEAVYLPRGFRSYTEFIDSVGELIDKVYSRTQMLALAHRTLTETSCQEATTFAYFTNQVYGDIARRRHWALLTGGSHVAADAQQSATP